MWRWWGIGEVRMDILGAHARSLKILITQIYSATFVIITKKLAQWAIIPPQKSAIEIRVTAHLALVHWDQEECVWAIPNYSLKADWTGQRGSVQRAEAALRGKSWPTFSDLNTICHKMLKLSFLRNSVKEN